MSAAGSLHTVGRSAHNAIPAHNGAVGSWWRGWAPVSGGGVVTEDGAGVRWQRHPPPAPLAFGATAGPGLAFQLRRGLLIYRQIE